MKDDIRIWEIDGSSKAAKPVESTNRMETENSLEEVLVRNPDLLMPGLTLVGRQTPVDGGKLDLLGVDADGRLVVLELKREKLTRDAVAQVIDYCSWLDSLTEADLASYIAQHSGKHDVDKIPDFESWYGVRRRKQLIDLRPTRMALVGLGADSRAHRMVEFLMQRDVDIMLLTFHGYTYGDRTLLARQVERGEEVRGIGTGRKKSQAELRAMLAEQARELGMDGLWQEAIKTLRNAFDRTATKAGITFSQPGITLPGISPSDNVNVYATHSVVIDPPEGIRVTFFPGAVHVCWDKFQEAAGTIPFEFEKPPAAWPTERVPEQWYCRLDKTTWKKHKKVLTLLANDVFDACKERRRSASEA